MPLGTEVGLGADDIVLDGDSAASSPKRDGVPSQGAAPPQFLAHVYCGQTAGSIKMALGMEMGLGPGHIVLDGTEPSIFGQSLLWPNGWMHQDATWYGGRPQPMRLCGRWGPSPLTKKGRSAKFSANVYCGQTAAWMKMPLSTG